MIKGKSAVTDIGTQFVNHQNVIKIKSLATNHEFISSLSGGSKTPIRKKKEIPNIINTIFI
jgi:hypothetical protein